MRFIKISPRRKQEWMMYQITRRFHRVHEIEIVEWRRHIPCTLHSICNSTIANMVLIIGHVLKVCPKYSQQLTMSGFSFIISLNYFGRKKRASVLIFGIFTLLQVKGCVHTKFPFKLFFLGSLKIAKKLCLELAGEKEKESKRNEVLPNFHVLEKPANYFES